MAGPQLFRHVRIRCCRAVPLRDATEIRSEGSFATGWRIKRPPVTAFASNGDCTQKARAPVAATDSMDVRNLGIWVGLEFHEPIPTTAGGASGRVLTRAVLATDTPLESPPGAGHPRGQRRMSVWGQKLSCPKRLSCVRSTPQKLPTCCNAAPKRGLSFMSSRPRRRLSGLPPLALRFVIVGRLLADALAQHLFQRHGTTVLL